MSAEPVVPPTESRLAYLRRRFYDTRDADETNALCGAMLEELERVSRPALPAPPDPEPELIVTPEIRARVAIREAIHRTATAAARITPHNVQRRYLTQANKDAILKSILEDFPVSALPAPEPPHAKAYAPWTCPCGFRNEVRPVAWETFIRCASCGEKRPEFDLASFGAPEAGVLSGGIGASALNPVVGNASPALPAAHAPPDALSKYATNPAWLDSANQAMQALYGAAAGHPNQDVIERNVKRIQEALRGSRPALAGSPEPSEAQLIAQFNERAKYNAKWWHVEPTFYDAIPEGQRKYQLENERAQWGIVMRGAALSEDQGAKP